MATTKGRWNNIPSVIVVDILRYLPLKDRLNASATCNNWRECLFHPTLWPKIILKVNSCSSRSRPKVRVNGNLIKTCRNENNEGANFLVNRCGRFAKEVLIEINSRNAQDVQECADILQVLTYNLNLQGLTLKPTSCRLEWNESDCRQETPLPEEYISLLLRIIRNAHSLHHLSLGCIEELLDQAECLLTLLGQRQSKSLKSLHLASIKENPDHYPLLEIAAPLFDPFTNLCSLSIDYDYLTDELIHVLAKPNRRSLYHLAIHVHGIDAEHRGTSDNAWYQLRTHSPALEVTLNLLHSNDSATILRNILHLNMPLVTFRSYFSEGVDHVFLDMLATFNSQTLRSVTMVESLGEERSPTGILTTGQEDPLVMLAWRCQKLSQLTIIGYDLSEIDLIAIARLRGPQLRKLSVPSCCISMTYGNSLGGSNGLQGGFIPIENNGIAEETSLYFDSVGDDAQFALLEEISSSLGYHWNPMALNELPCPVFNLNMDADGAYLPFLLEDQGWDKELCRK